MTSAFEEQSDDVTLTVTAKSSASSGDAAPAVVLTGAPVQQGQALLAVNKQQLRQPFQLQGHVVLVKGKSVTSVMGKCWGSDYAYMYVNYLHHGDGVLGLLRGCDLETYGATLRLAGVC